MAKTWTETRLADKVDITFERRITGGVTDWVGKIEGRTIANISGGPSVLFRAVDFQNILPNFTTAQQNQIKAAMDLITQRFATHLEIDPS